MRTSLISITLALFTTIFTTTTTATGPVPGVASFKLKADSSAPTDVAGRTVTWDGTFDGNLGFFGSGAKEVTAFIQYNETEGIAFYTLNTRLQIWLRPTHGAPAYFTKLGDPRNDPTPELTLSTNFTVDESAGEPGNYVFGYEWGAGFWSACGGPEEYTLYYGPVSAPRSGCTANFGLDLFYE